MSPKYKFSTLLAALVLVFTLCGCTAAEDKAAAPLETPAPTPAPVEYNITVTEFMEKNRAVLKDEDGDFSDWVELYNAGDEAVNLKGWRLSDDAGQKGWKFPDVSIAPGEYMVVFASNKEKDGGAELHADFAISGDESVCLKDSAGNLVFETACGGCEADVAMAFVDAQWQQSLYPTPGFENSPEGYEQYQQKLKPGGPLTINEVMTFDDSVLWAGMREYCDWVEIKNISDSPVELSEYWLSDDDDDYFLYRLPEYELYPGQCYIILCDDEQGNFEDIYPNSGFALASDSEQLYLSHNEGGLSDFCSLRSIPYGCSYGRSAEGEGFFFIEQPTPGTDNLPGARRISATPESPTKDGVYEGVDSVQVELTGPGTIRYTLDGSAPTEKSMEYTDPITVEKTTVVRASCFEEGALTAFPLTLSFIMNEGHSLPVLSLATDDPLGFRQMYDGMQKGVAKPGSISLYELDGDSFTVGCGVSLNGMTSLTLPKKNMSLRFREAYGAGTLDYDIYGGGVTEFSNLLLRAGQDFHYAVIRNELAQSISELIEPRFINQRSIWCVLYINGEYSGVYTLKEKANEQLYASVAGVSRDSVTVYEASVPYGTDFFEDTISFLNRNDISDPAVYEQFCSVMDVGSLIDWLIMEGFCANPDLASGNLRYASSTENDGKWRLMFYDLDASFKTNGNMYENLLTPHASEHLQVGAIAYSLMGNDSFRESFLQRASELYATVLTNETVLSEIDRHVAQVRPELERDFKRFGMDMEHWEWYLADLRSLIIDCDWQRCCIDSICNVFELSPQQRAYYFGENN